jgi:hypothetical protein
MRLRPSKDRKTKAMKFLVIKDAAASAEISITTSIASLEAPAAANKKKESDKGRERRSALGLSQSGRDTETL